MIETPS
jgi:hypothetical protein